MPSRRGGVPQRVWPQDEEDEVMVVVEEEEEGEEEECKNCFDDRRVPHFNRYYNDTDILFSKYLTTKRQQVVS